MNAVYTKVEKNNLLTATFMNYFGFVAHKRRKKFWIKIISVAIVAILFVVLCVTFLNAKRGKEFAMQYFAVGVCATDKKQIANNLSSTLQAKGASGLVVTQDDFFVLCFLYDKKSEAKQIEKGLLEQGYDAKIETIKIEKMCKSANKYIKNNENILNCKLFFAEMFKSLKTKVAQFDGGKIKESKIFSDLKQLERRATLLAVCVDEKNKIDECFVCGLENICVYINKFLKNASLASQFSAGLKTLCFEVLFEWQRLVANVNASIEN